MTDFDFDRAVADWRRRMAGSGVKDPEVLDELESHLREEVEHQQTTSALTPRKAFAAAVRTIGSSFELHREFENARINPDTPDEAMKHKLIRRILVIIAIMAVETGFILPEIARRRMAHETFSAWTVVCFLAVAAAFTVVASWAGIRSLDRMEKRLRS